MSIIELLRPYNPYNEELAPRLRSLVALQRTQALFPVPVWSLTTVHNSSSQEYKVLF